MATIVTAMRSGARDFLVKPLDLQHVKPLLERLLEDKRTRISRKVMDRTESAADTDLVGRDPKMIEIFKTIGQAAATRATVLVRGESGTGKELVARAIHENSNAAAEPFVAINCAALPSTLLESELFGHTKGSFTGAVTSRRGCFAMAGRGTVFLDEIGDTSIEFQSKLLRVLQSREFQPVGAETTQRTDARVIAATHRDLEDLVARRLFREDLYYRLRVVEIMLPPLRDRAGDIPHIVDHILERVGTALEIPVPRVSPDGLAALMTHAWPGNVREMENCLMRAAVVAPSDVIRPDHLSLLKSRDDATPVLQSLEDVEREHIARVLRATGGHKSKAAEILQLSRSRLNRMLHRYGLE
jgi:DNA-binding NtrC family response regulator